MDRRVAEAYEAFFLPALLSQWVGPVVDAAGIQAGDRVLDVACGTGVLARGVVPRVGPRGSVVGLDVEEGMLAAARSKAPAIEWRCGRAEALPFDGGSFDAVVSQFGLMFFEDRRLALAEMMRVLRPGGRMAVAVWGPIEDSPGYALMAPLLDRLLGEAAVKALLAPFSLSDPKHLHSLFASAGMPEARITTRMGTARFPSVESWIRVDLKDFTLGDLIDDAKCERLLDEARQVVQPFVLPDGTLRFGVSANIATVGRPEST